MEAVVLILLAAAVILSGLAALRLVARIELFAAAFCCFALAAFLPPFAAVVS